MLQHGCRETVHFLVLDKPDRKWEFPAKNWVSALFKARVSSLLWEVTRCGIHIILNESSSMILLQKMIFRWSVLDSIALFLICKLGSHKFSPAQLVPEKQTLNDLNSAGSTVGWFFSKECRQWCMKQNIFILWGSLSLRQRLPWIFHPHYYLSYFV